MKPFYHFVPYEGVNVTALRQKPRELVKFVLEDRRVPTTLGLASKAFKTGAAGAALVGSSLAPGLWAAGIATGAAASAAYSLQAVNRAYTEPRVHFRRRSGFISMPRKALKRTKRRPRRSRARAQRKRTLAKRVQALEKQRQRKYLTTTTSMTVGAMIEVANGTWDTSGWWGYDFVYPNIGSDINEREGRSFHPDSLYLRGEVALTYSTTSLAAGLPVYWRMILLQDMQCNAKGAFYQKGTVSDQRVKEFIQDENEINTLYNMDKPENFGRFQVILDEKFVITQQPITATGGVGAIVPFERMIKKRIRPITFAGDGAGSTYSSVEKGHLIMMHAYYTTNPVGLSVVPTIHFTYRWRWQQD